MKIKNDYTDYKLQITQIKKELDYADKLNS